MWLTWADRFIFSIYWFTNSFHFHFFNPKLANQTTFPTKARPPPSLLRKKKIQKTILTRRARMIQNWYNIRYKKLSNFCQTRKLIVLQPIGKGVIRESVHSGVTWERGHFGFAFFTNWSPKTWIFSNVVSLFEKSYEFIFWSYCGHLRSLFEQPLK